MKEQLRILIEAARLNNLAAEHWADKGMAIFKEQIEKMLVLTDEEIQKIFDLAYDRNQAYNAGMSQEPCEPEDMMKEVAQAQLAKDTDALRGCE